MSKEIFVALSLLEKERGIPVSFMLQKIEKSILTACRSNYGNEDIVVNIEPKDEVFDVFLTKIIKEKVENKTTEISPEEARKIDPDAKIDDKVLVPIDTKEFGRIAAQTARNIIRQGIRDSERDQISKEFQDLKKNIVSAVIEKIDLETGVMTLKIGKAEVTFTKQEQIDSEIFEEGDRIKVYVVDVKETERGPRVTVSRTHPDFVGKLFEAEIPEVADGTIEIKSISREAGSRSKVAVSSNNIDVEAVGACIGPRSTRIETISEELGGEKIDIIPYDKNPSKFIASALLPARVSEVIVNEEDESDHSCRAIVPDSQLSLAIGSRGQNVRLAVKLTHFKIDIVSEVNAGEG
ncbi:MAG: transcription termination factor NusA [Oscillospiraceae bacterium]|jgi:N utilization substance protein A|nr:transcription termination factor NusA [Oscillospiraceae bacterium]